MYFLEGGTEKSLPPYHLDRSGNRDFRQLGISECALPDALEGFREDDLERTGFVAKAVKRIFSNAFECVGQDDFNAFAKDKGIAANRSAVRQVKSFALGGGCCAPSMVGNVRYAFR